MSFESLYKLDVNDKVDVKQSGSQKNSYLSWAWAWAEFMKVYPDATYEIVKNENNLPYFEDGSGAMVYTRVTVDGLTHEMWLPVMDGANKAMKSKPYTYKVNEYANGKRTGNMVDKEVDAFTMFDINKTIMRCLTKNLAMFGLGLYIYAKEDLPEETEEERLEKMYPVPEKQNDTTKKRMWNEYLRLLQKQQVVEKDFRAFLVGKNIDFGLVLHTWLKDETILNKLIKEYKGLKDGNN